MRAIVVLLALLCVSQAGAQEPPSRPQKTEPGRAVACQEAAAKKGLGKREARDDVTICTAEARLDCLKQAIAAGKRGPDRQTAIAACMDKVP